MIPTASDNGTSFQLARKLRFDYVNEFDCEILSPSDWDPSKMSDFTFRGRIPIDTGLHSYPLFNMVAHITHKAGEPFVSFRFFRPSRTHGTMKMKTERTDGFSRYSLVMTFFDKNDKENFSYSQDSKLDWCGIDCDCSQGILCHFVKDFCSIESFLDSIKICKEDVGCEFYAYLYANVSLRIKTKMDTNYTEPLHMSSLPLIMEKILKDSHYDLIIKVDGKELKAHTYILAAHSDVFEAMFQSDMKEKKTKILEVEDIPLGAMESLLKYLYYEDFRDIQEDTQIATDLLRVADKYNIKDLQKLCLDILHKSPLENFSLSSAFDYFLCGSHLSLPNVEQHAITVLKSKTIEMRGSDCFDDFVKMTADVLPPNLSLFIKINNIFKSNLN